VSKVDVKKIKGVDDNDLEQWLLSGDGKKDKVKGAIDTVAANKLRPSQNEIFLGKALGMSILGVLGKAPLVGGYLGAIWSKERYIMDGHHRWAATMLGAPELTITGYKIELPFSDLMPILRKAGRVFGKYSNHEEDTIGKLRDGNPGGATKSDINLYDATDQDLEDFIYKGKYTSEKFYKKDDGIAYLEKIGGMDVLKKRLKAMQKIKPPSDAPPRVLMPVIRGENVITFPMKVDDDGNVILSSTTKQAEEKLIVNLLKQGKVQVMTPVELKECRQLLSPSLYFKIVSEHRRT
jgi:hypothetical protein